MRNRVILAAGALALLAAPAQAQGRFEGYRWEEDWSGSETAYKDIQLGPFRLDLGGDARWKAESVSNPRYGLTTQTDDSWLQQRLLLHANLRAGEHVRLFAELGAHDVIDRTNRGSSDDNSLDWHQAFLDLMQDWDGGDIRLRLGRQEIAMAERFLGMGDSSNIRAHYDGARLFVNLGDWAADFVAVNPVQNRVDAFDDGVIPGDHLHGVRVDRDGAHWDLHGFFYDHARQNLALGGFTANERRRTWGAGAEFSQGPWGAELELIRQTGSRGVRDIDAWGGFAEATRKLDGAWRPRIGARLTYGGGDSDLTDNDAATYAPPFPRGSWFNEGGLVSHSNTVEAALTGSVQPHETLRFDGKLGGLWRADTADFLYVSTQTAIAGTAGLDESFTGVTARLQLNWRPNPHVTVRGELAGVSVSDGLAAIGAEDFGYANASLALRF